MGAFTNEYCFDLEEIDVVGTEITLKQFFWRDPVVRRAKVRGANESLIYLTGSHVFMH